MTSSNPPPPDLQWRFSPEIGFSVLWLTSCHIELFHPHTWNGADRSWSGRWSSGSYPLPLFEASTETPPEHVQRQALVELRTQLVAQIEEIDRVLGQAPTSVPSLGKHRFKKTGDSIVGTHQEDLNTAQEYDTQIFEEIQRELTRQVEKWGLQDHDPQTWYAILGEEFGEVGKAILDSWHHPGGDRSTQLEYRTELIQVAAVAIAAVRAFDILWDSIP